ncbi:uncharacterized protein LOC100679082 isoform X2 [Nasonia vitripennis]|uniref:Uncharacterized protein n=1 Tax=Nasonia vitripennis TaxID=7425 RepID=A0A7M7GBZ9_NASVI|nr:uncharacterized protein LOC100679082 isoform X2 [Nasonia vitripennis]
MMRKVNACTGVIVPLLILVIVKNANALPIQYLPEVPGFIPVYIRYGDQPLEEINPMLAEAFHESTGISKSIGENKLDESASEKTKKDSPAQVIPLKQLISALSQDRKDNIKNPLSENESIVEKLNEFLPLENIEVKIIMGDQAKR